MNLDPSLQSFLNSECDELVEALKSDILAHIGNLRADGQDLNGYAILPGAEDTIVSLVANYTAGFSVGDGDSCLVDEWPNYCYDQFPNADKFISQRKEDFEALVETCESEDLECQFRGEHLAKLFALILKGLSEARAEVFPGDEETFAVVWIPGSSHEIMGRSARELNSPAVYETYLSECG